MERMEKTNNLFSLLNKIKYLILKSGVKNWNDFQTILYISELRECADLCKKCNVTSKDIYNECWTICRNVDDLSKVADWLQNRVDNVFNTLYNIIDMNQQNVISLPIILHIFAVHNHLYRLQDFLLIWHSNFEIIINDLRRQPQSNHNADTSKATDLELPNELNTQKAQKYFLKAITAGYIRKTEHGFKWLFGGAKGQVRLGYFCNKVYSTPRPINKLEELFGVKKLSSSITAADLKYKRADVIEWRKEIDDKIFNE